MLAYEPLLTRRPFAQPAARRSRIGRSRARTGSAITKAILAVLLACIAGAAFLWMSQEQQARAASQELYSTLAAAVDEQLTIDEVHERLGREPSKSRNPFRKRLVEEYTYRGPFESHTVYAYYSIAATKILEAASIDQTLDNWETE